MGSIKQNLANNILSDGKFDATDLDGTIPNTNINDNSIDNVTSFPAAGSGIPSVASDPPSPSAGDVWYNTTSNAFKYVGVTTAGSWASGGNLNTARASSGGAGTDNTSALAFGGFSPSLGTPSRTAITESYNGTSWTEVNDLNTARSNLAGAGTQTAALGFGGVDGPPFVRVGNTETWNGSNWTEVNDLNTGRSDLAGVGTQTSALGFAGTITPGTNITESWNGTSWTEVNDLNTVRFNTAGAGANNTSALCFGGDPGSASNALTELWNGTSWTEVNDLNTQRKLHGGVGTQTSALAIGGDNDVVGPSITAVTEQWDGTSWTEVNDLNTARSRLTGVGADNTAALAFGGGLSPTTTATEEWTAGASPVTKTVTTA